MNRQALERLRSAVAGIADLERRGPEPPASAETAVLKRAIPAIRDALLRDFQETAKPRYQLLHDALAGSGIPLPALSVCGRGTREIRYTQLFRYFLDPVQPHGLGSKLLVAFLAPELKDVELAVEKVSWDDASVEAEVPLGAIRVGKRSVGSKIDLFIQLDNLVVLVESKIRSPESGSVGSGEMSQLRRYSAAFAKHFRHLRDQPVLKIFLTPERREPKEDVDWMPLSHGDLLDRLARVLGDEGVSRIARHNLAAFLWDLICGPLAFGGRERTELVARLSNALEDSAKSIPLRAWCARNVPHLDIMLWTLEICHE